MEQTLLLLVYGIHTIYGEMGSFELRELRKAQNTWNTSIKTYDTSSYVYQLQKTCSDCTQCDQQPKYILVDNNKIILVEYSDSNSLCLEDSPILITDYDAYLTIDQWFLFIQQHIDMEQEQNDNGFYNQYQNNGYNEYNPNQNNFAVEYDGVYNYPNWIFIDDRQRYDVLCLSFLINAYGNESVNKDSTSYCLQYSSWRNAYNYNHDTSTTAATVPLVNCKTEVITKDDCTEWLYIYITIIISTVVSILSILMFWLYIRQGIEIKGYKMSRGISNEDIDSDDDRNVVIQNKNKKKNKKKHKKTKKKSRIRKLLDDIDENKQIPKINLKRKKRRNKYGSVAQSDPDDEEKEEQDDDGDGDDNDNDNDDDDQQDDDNDDENDENDENDDTDDDDDDDDNDNNPFVGANVNDQKQNDDWEFVDDKDNPFVGASQSDQTDDESDDDD